MKITIYDPSDAAKLLNWIASRGGIAVWQNRDLGSPPVGSQSFTPAITDGQPAVAPHGVFGNAPVALVTDPADVSVRARKEVKRVKARHS
jgi:hypothetical protein